LSFDGLIAREWLATNALGGYACSTIPSLNTRKYHGLLVAAMAPPVRRMVLLSRVEETVHYNGWPFPLACNEYPGTIHPEGHRFLRAFSHEPFPRWAYQGDGWTLEKSLHLVRGRNTVVLSYTLLGGDKPIDLELRPLLALRGIHELTYQWQAPLTVETIALPTAAEQRQVRGARAYAHGQCHRVPATGRTPEVFFAHDGTFDAQPAWYFNTIYRREQERGYPGLEDLWMPGVVKYHLAPGQSIHFACSTDPIELGAMVSHSAGGDAARPPHADETISVLARAADQFVASIPNDSPDKGVAVVTQYPWSAPSGRLALIAFPGLFLATGRYAEARSLLLSYAKLLDGGLLPSEFPEDGSPPLYHGADVSLWFVYAVHQYLRYTGDAATVRRELYDALAMIVHYYLTGTRLGIAAGADGLISTSEPGIGTTWMDAGQGDSVVTPRAGKPVDLNALWFNCLRTVAELSEIFEEPRWAAELGELANSVKMSFNELFWNEAAGCCYDVITDAGPDPAVRPNQLLATSLPFPVLDLPRHEQVLRKVRDELLTPLGVRTLSPSDPHFQPRYAGNVPARDRAHYNGSVFPWLLGPLVTTHARVHGRGAQARAAAMDMLRGCLDHVAGDGLGQLCELFDGAPPHAPGGAVAAAAAVGEVLRAYVEHVADDRATAETSAPADDSRNNTEPRNSAPVLEVFLPPSPVPEIEPA
jgi:predicted glycogen debranching enzyme